MKQQFETYIQSYVMEKIRLSVKFLRKRYNRSRNNEAICKISLKIIINVANMVRGRPYEISDAWTGRLVGLQKSDIIGYR